MGDAATPTLPDFTSQTASAYKANIDAGFAVADRVAWAFAAHEQATPDMSVRLEAGAVFDGAVLTAVAAQSTGTIAAPTTDPRIDRVVVNRATGAVSVITGAEAPSPSPPAITGNVAPIAQVALIVSQTSIVNGDITDERDLALVGLGKLATDDINGLTEDTTPDTAADFVATYDASAAVAKKAKLTNLGLTDDVARNNILLNAFRIAINGGLSVLNMQDGFVDEFEDETGVDTAASTNETFDSAGAFYHNPSETVAGTFSQPNTTGQAWGDAGTSAKHIGFLFRNVDAGDIKSVEIDVSGHTANLTGHVEVWTDSAGSPGSQVEGDSDSVTISKTGGVIFTWSTSVPTLSVDTDYWLVFVDEGTTGDILVRTCLDQGGSFKSGKHDTITSIADASGGFPSGSDWRVEAITDFTSPNMTLASKSVTAEAEPTEARIVLFEEDVDAVTINTDLKAYASRDGGTTTTQITLTDEGNFSGTVQIPILEGDGVVLGDMVDHGGLASGFDGDTTKTRLESASEVNSQECFIGKDWGSGVTRTVNGVKIWSTSDTGYQETNNQTITFELQGSTDNFGASIVGLGSGSIADGISIIFTKLSGFTTTTAYRYHRIKMTSPSVQGDLSIAQVQFFEDSTVVKQILAGSADISGQPSATAMEYKIESLNNKELRLHGVALQWS